MLVAFCFMGSFKLNAMVADFRDGNLYYKITSIEKRECCVYGPIDEVSMIEKLIVPATAQYNGTSFTVVGVWGDPLIPRHRSNFSNVKKVILPKTVKWIGEYAFHGCSNLESVQMEDIEEIKSNAFSYCKKLRTISTSAKKLRFLGDACFMCCEKLEKVVIPPSCKEIESGAFMECVSPNHSVVIEDSDEPLFCNSTFGSGSKIYIGRNLWSKEWYDSYLGKKFHQVYGGDIYWFNEVVLGDKVSEIFWILLDRPYDVETVQHLTIGASIKEVSDFSKDGIDIKTIHMVSEEPPTFLKNPYGSEGEFSNRTYLHCTLYVPKGSLSAYKNARVWKNFLNIQEYESERTIAAHNERSRIAQETQRKEEAARKAQEERERRAKEEAERKAMENPVIPDGTTEIVANAYTKKPIKTITIPNSVKKIGDNAFAGCYLLNSVQIPNNVTSIGKGAFDGCKTMVSVNIGNGVKYIGDKAFNKCELLTSIKIPNSVTSIGKKAFSGCTLLKSVTIGNNVTSIGEEAFSWCTSLSSISIPSSVSEIGEAAFCDCSKLTSIILPSKVTKIENRTFESCRELKSVTIGDNVASIGDNAFSRCSSLTSISIPNSVTSIGKGAFYWCQNLTSITIPKSVTEIGEDAFYGCYNLEISLPKKLRGKVDVSKCKSVKYY